MDTVKRMMARLAAGQLVVIDGATGSECERRGVPQLEGAWSGGAALSHPDIVRQIHRDYLEAGAELIIANTFGTHRHVLETAGVAEDFEAYNRRAVELTVEARAEAGVEDAVVAGGISNWTWKGETPPLDVLRRNAADQAAVLAAGGAELLILEMMIDIDRMRATLDGAITAGLPVWVGFSCGSWAGTPSEDDGVIRLVDGEPLADGIDALDGYDVGAVFIMHTPVELIDACLTPALERWAGPLGVYAHSSDGVYGDWFGQGISPAAHRAAAKGWIERGVRIIGSCCGTGPEHIRALTELR